MKSDVKRAKKLKRLRSINFVLLKYLLLLAFLLVVFVEVTCYIIVSNTAEEQARQKLTMIGRDVAVNIGGDVEKETSDYLRSYLQDGVNAFVISPDGRILLPVEDTTGIDWSDNIESIKTRLSKAGKGASVIYQENNELIYASALNYNGTSYLVLMYSLDLIMGTSRILIVYFVVVGVLVLLVSVIISYTVSQKLSSGLKNLSKTAVRFSKGDFSVNFADAEYQELADLSDTLNSVRDEVKKSGDFQRELLANVSHDFKTPLTMIKAYASMIREISGDNPEKRDEHLQVIIDEADRLTGLVNDVLNLSKVSSNLEEINVKVFNLTEFLYGIINKFGYLQETQGYNLMVDIDSNLYTCADKEKIGQVIYNLLGNAVNYTGEDKTVYVSLKKSLTEDRIKLTVKDTGKGISKEELPHIWDRYYRVKENHSRPVKGTGLGLNIVRLILENHKFDFGVQSEPNKGSSFWVDFPSVPPDIDIEQ